MKNLARNIFLSLAGANKKVASGVHILNSHYIGREDISIEVFSNLLKKLNNQANFIKIQDALTLIKEKESLNEKLIAFTFDDGFEECYTKVAPVLKSFNTNAAFFINPGFINGDQSYIENFNNNIVHVKKNPMTWEMIKELHNDGFIIGNHTMDHKRLIGLNDEENEFQISESKRLIEEQLGTTCDHFAWTYGTLNDIDNKALELALKEHQYVFSGDNYTKYYSLDNRVLNRRHIEGDWPLSHVKYFLSHPKQY